MEDLQTAMNRPDQRRRRVMTHDSGPVVPTAQDGPEMLVLTPEQAAAIQPLSTGIEEVLDVALGKLGSIADTAEDMRELDAHLGAHLEVVQINPGAEETDDVVKLASRMCDSALIIKEHTGVSGEDQVKAMQRVRAMHDQIQGYLKKPPTERFQHGPDAWAYAAIVTTKRLLGIWDARRQTYSTTPFRSEYEVMLATNDYSSIGDDVAYSCSEVAANCRLGTITTAMMGLDSCKHYSTLTSVSKASTDFMAYGVQSFNEAEQWLAQVQSSNEQVTSKFDSMLKAVDTVEEVCMRKNAAPVRAPARVQGGAAGGAAQQEEAAGEAAGEAAAAGSVASASGAAGAAAEIVYPYSSNDMRLLIDQVRMWRKPEWRPFAALTPTSRQSTPKKPTPKKRSHDETGSPAAEGAGDAGKGQDQGASSSPPKAPKTAEEGGPRSPTAQE